MAIDILADIEQAIRLFTDIASDPLSAVLLGMGALLVGASVAVLGVLSAGGVVSALGRFAESPDQQG